MLEIARDLLHRLFQDVRQLHLLVVHHGRCTSTEHST
jgi:hypothetical protein